MTDHHYHLDFDAEETFQFKSIAFRSPTGYFLHAEKQSTGIEYWIKVTLKKHTILRYNTPSYLLDNDHIAHLLCIMERTILATLQNHPFLPTLSYAMQTSEYTLLVTEKLHGESLKDLFHLRPTPAFQENVVQFYMAELLLAVQHLHTVGIVHRNISLHSLFLTKRGHLQLIDFGAAVTTNLQDTLFKKNIRIPLPDIMQTTNYLPPEYYDGQCIGYAGDLWAVGACLFELLTGTSLITMDFLRDTHAALNLLSADAQDLILQLLRREPAERPSCEDIQRHAFFQNVQWEELVVNGARNTAFGNSTPYIPKMRNFSLARSFTLSNMCEIMKLEMKMISSSGKFPKKKE